VTTRPPRDDEPGARDPLDRALAALSVVDLDPLVARAHYVAAEARLTRTRVLSTRYERREPGLLLGLAGLHLAWALVRVFAS
jgi:hypothetical protein